MGNLSLGIGLAAGAGFYLYRKFTSVNDQEENSENSASQSATCTQEASEDGDPTEKDLGDVSTKEDSTTVITNETQVEVQRIKEDASSLQNGVDKQQEISTRNPTERQKAAEKKHHTKKSNFGGLKKGFLLY